MLLHDLKKKSLINPPNFIEDNTHFLAIMGSYAYGVSEPDSSDYDIYGFCIPPKTMVFPHLNGEIPGFGKQHKRFEQFQQQHIQDSDKEYDVSIYSIVKFFQLCMENNPNMVDCLFAPQHSVLHCSRIGQMVKHERKLFLHKGCFHKFQGYAYSQLNKAKENAKYKVYLFEKKKGIDYSTTYSEVMKGSDKIAHLDSSELREYIALLKHTEDNEKKSKRWQNIYKFGFDTKFVYHIYRLLDECEQILTFGDLDLMRSKEVLRSIRRGEWTLQQIEDHFRENESRLRKIYDESKAVPYSPNEEQIKNLLLNCLEEHYGDLSKCVAIQNKEQTMIKEIVDVLKKYKEI